MSEFSQFATISRRTLLKAGLPLAAVSIVPFGRANAAAGETTTYGLSTFGDLELPPDFKHFTYVNPSAPKGGRLRVMATTDGGNTNPQTFNTLNTFIFNGDGAAGMRNTFDTLMVQNLDEPSSFYGLVASHVTVSADKLTYRFFLRPEARFHDGSRLTATDVAFSLNILKAKGHPVYKSQLDDFVKAEVETDAVVRVILAKDRGRDAHLTIVQMPIFSATYWKTRDFEETTFEAPLGSGPYKVHRLRPGRFIRYRRVENYWAKNLPVAAGFNNFKFLRFEYYRDRQIAFEAFKSGALDFHEEFTSRRWHTAYDFPAIHDGSVVKLAIPDNTAVSTQGWYFNTRRYKFRDRRVREAIAILFDFEWTNRNIMYSTYKRMTSFFENTDLKAKGKPGADEVKVLGSLKGDVPKEIFGEPWIPPVGSGRGYDRRLLRKASNLLKAAGCKVVDGVMYDPKGQVFEIEFLNSRSSFKAHTEPFQENLRKLGILSTFRVVDASQYKRRIDTFDYDITIMALSGTLTPDNGLQNIYSSESAANPGSQNRAGISDPIVDQLLELVAHARTRTEMTTAARVLDRVLRAGHYWIPMWYKDTNFVAYWDRFGRPAKTPRYGSGAPDTWWRDISKVL